MKSSKEIRQSFLDFFQSRAHAIVASAPIIIKDDPTLMFTNAGMNQFKDNFLGIKEPNALRIANTQKCLRVSGKHNDLEEVGHDTYHHTMFEMLGNWSFGDYYKREAIEWAWEYLTKSEGVNPEDLYATIFGGDEELGLGEDKEALEEWKKWLPEKRILRCGKKDNFWEMGDVGPCGPCSELHVDVRSPAEKEKVPGAQLVNMDHPQVIEVWNLVFMEFNKDSKGSLEQLPAKNVDTGMGLERLVMVLQGKTSNYDTDLFSPYIDFLEKEFGFQYGQNEEESVAIRVVIDHLRAVCFSIADGELPSNTGAGYVIRRILRRASRYAFQFLGITKPFIYNLVDVLVKVYDQIFPELAAQSEFIKTTIQQEEKSFLHTLARGTQLFENYLAENAGKADKQVEGKFAFKLYDTFGFPLDLTGLMAREKGWTLDVDGFNYQMGIQRDRARIASQIKTGDWVEVSPMEEFPHFTGYERSADKVHILRHRTSEANSGEIYQLVLDSTPFYPEGGGQVGDTGWLRKGDNIIQVLDTKKENDLIVHFVNELPSDASGTWVAEVDTDRRRLIKANHSATHLLHAALRQVLGTHVEQRGSLVNDKLLRFDFSHPTKLSPEEIMQIERIVNEKVAEGIKLVEHRDVPIAKAKEMGATALFGEKYGNTVRVIVFDSNYSIELCGGIHVDNTQEIRLFKIVSEGSVAAGIRRVEAYTSDGAFSFLSNKVEMMLQMKELLYNPKNPVKALRDLIDRQKKLEKKIQKLQQELAGGLKDDLLKQIKVVNGRNLLTAKVDTPSAKEMKALAFDLIRDLKNGVLVLAGNFGGKVNLIVALTKDLVKTGDLHAGDLVREIAEEVGGGGGGQVHFASAGGKNPAGIPAAFSKAEKLISK